MLQIKRHIYILLMLLTISMWSQETLEDDPEILQNNIDYRISEAEFDIINFNYFEAQKKLDDALQIALKAKNQTSVGIIYSKKGKLQLLIEEQDEAIKSLNAAVKVQRDSKDNVNLANSFKTLGEVYLSKKDYYQALDYFISAKTLFEQEGLNKNLAETLFLEGKNYIYLENYKKARVLFEQSIALAKNEDLVEVESNALINHGKVYAYLGDNEKALALTNEGIKLAKNNKFIEILKDGYLILSEINQNIKNYETSNFYLKSFIKLSDSLRVIKKANLSPEKQIKSLMNDQIKKNKETEEEL